jgi:hypothetical protein
VFFVWGGDLDLDSRSRSRLEKKCLPLPTYRVTLGLSVALF